MKLMRKAIRIIVNNKRLSKEQIHVRFSILRQRMRMRHLPRHQKIMKMNISETWKLREVIASLILKGLVYRKLLGV